MLIVSRLALGFPRAFLLSCFGTCNYYANLIRATIFSWTYIDMGRIWVRPSALYCVLGICFVFLNFVYIWCMTTTKTGEAAKGARPQVTVEMVQEWVKRDVASGAYFLSMLMRHPDVVQKIADELFAEVQRESSILDKEADQDGLD